MAIGLFSKVYENEFVIEKTYVKLRPFSFTFMEWSKKADTHTVSRVSAFLYHPVFLSLLPLQ